MNTTRKLVEAHRNGDHRVTRSACPECKRPGGGTHTHTQGEAMTDRTVTEQAEHLASWSATDPGLAAQALATLALAAQVGRIADALLELGHCLSCDHPRRTDMTDTITRDDARFAETIASLKAGDEVEVEWSFNGETATARGLLREQENCHLYLAHTFPIPVGIVCNKWGSSAATVASIRIIKRV